MAGRTYTGIGDRNAPFLLFFFLLSFTVAAQSDRAQQQLYPEKLHEDVDALMLAIEASHPDPYRFRSKSELGSIVQQVKSSIKVPMDAVQLMPCIMPIFHAIGDAHCYPELAGAHREQLRQTTPLLPLKVRILEDGVFVEEELKGFRSIPSGSRVISINGKQIDDVISICGDAIVGDGNNLTYKLRRTEQELHWLYGSLVDASEVFTIRFVLPDGTEQEETIFAMTGDEIDRSRKPKGASLLPWGANWEAESGTMWVTMRTCDPLVIGKAGQRPDRFLDAMLSELKETKAHTLVLDVRGAGGGEMGIADQIFAAIAKVPFDVSCSVKDPMDRSFPELDDLDRGMRGPSGLATKSYAYEHEPHSDKAKEQITPLSKAFNGKVHIVCDGLTRDAAALFVMQAKRSGRALVFGEETGSNAHMFSSEEHRVIQLPNSGVHVRIPFKQFIPSGTPSGPMDHGEYPDHSVQQDPRSIAAGQDGVKLVLLRMIRELN